MRPRQVDDTGSSTNWRIIRRVISAGKDRSGHPVDLGPVTMSVEGQPIAILRDNVDLEGVSTTS